MKVLVSLPTCILPELHELQLADPSVDILPCGHPVHLAAPALDAWFPLHCTHTLLLLAPISVPFFPGGHALHVADEAAPVAVE